jgi:leader peptidase (prepilin peptidase)/N-methyltransferase
MMRGIKFLFEKGMGREALGLGDADLMMMAGAFLGWQLVVIAFVVGTFAALFFTVPFVLLRGARALPFGPGLATGALVTLLCWRWIGPGFQRYFFDWLSVLVAGTIMGGGMFLFSLVIGRRE